MADKDTGPGGPSGIGDRPQDDFVARNLSDPSDRPAKTLTLSGLLGDSDRPGHRRLYFNKQLDYYAEFASDDVVSVEDIPSDQPPFVGLDATKVTLRREAPVAFTQVQTAAPVDDFDLDLRLGQAEAQPGPAVGLPDTFDTEFPTLPTDNTLGCETLDTCFTCAGCQTRFGPCLTVPPLTRIPALCATVPPVTEFPRCHTIRGATCITCDTCLTCGGATCRTCGPRACFTTRTITTFTTGRTFNRTCITCACPEFP
ncbi:hypothetical protein [Kitasatospora sp. NPDC093806]|uniref:hypothetical protein n=1 Tax=Kitasatospora sp. NPDC093806 TaxID=3155075 RepID=UPI003441718E